MTISFGRLCFNPTYVYLLVRVVLNLEFRGTTHKIGSFCPLNELHIRHESLTFSLPADFEYDFFTPL
ncbi:hypothetical protein BpHYR1_042588 [Brachionus plicatilis]|uniref:Uncharacterized protein n=1 Tax=Brachionus plicatilis TaxID=10195 RepID=A0A3M7Q013_BRAPC|nr:hypothetical protein BpHYR1_042588 [Brachionus plicatilis]